MVKSNVTLGIDQDTLTWFRHHCKLQDAKMSLFVEKWIKKMKEELLAEACDDIRTCGNCGKLVSEAEWRRCFMSCPFCKSLIMWPERPKGVA